MSVTAKGSQGGLLTPGSTLPRADVDIVNDMSSLTFRVNKTHSMVSEIQGQGMKPTELTYAAPRTCRLTSVSAISVQGAKIEGA